MALRHRSAIICTAGVAAGIAAALSLIIRGRQPRALRHILKTALNTIAKDKKWTPGTTACVILSGGLDSGIVAEVGKEVLGLTHAITVIAADSATDLPWAVASAKAAGLQHHVVRVRLTDLLEVELPHVVKVLQSFDPMSLRNEIAGDAADELFGGYSFTHGLDADRWKHSQRRMAELMTFGSVPIGASFGVYVSSPFTQPAVIRAALRYSKDDCIAAGAGPDGKPLGKMPLRRAFPGVTSASRGKDPIEVGCGTTELSQPGYFNDVISDKEFAAGCAQAVEDGVVIRDKEHLWYYRVFRAVFPGGQVPGKTRGGPHACPNCLYPLQHPTQTFCHTCGHYDPNMQAASKANALAKRS